MNIIEAITPTKAKTDITIVAIEPHPNDKTNAYKKITLSAMGEVLK